GCWRAVCWCCCCGCAGRRRASWSAGCRLDAAIVPVPIAATCSVSAEATGEPSQARGTNRRRSATGCRTSWRRRWPCVTVPEEEIGLKRVDRREKGTWTAGETEERRPYESWQAVGEPLAEGSPLGPNQDTAEARRG
ncbi:hypothetical protein T310_8932, partial [Rasamsonia emersonii CBS 393.64]